MEQKKLVKDLVADLLKLDQEKPIWILYDCCYALIPEVTKATGEEIPDYIEKGDYKIDAW